MIQSEKNINNKFKMTKKIFVGALLAILIMASCGKKEKSNQVKITEIHPYILDFNFPDSISLNKITKGVVKYKMKLDSIDQLDVDERFVIFYVTPSEASSLQEIKNTEHTAFIDTTGNGNIEFKIDFPKEGNNVISGIIEDKIIFKTPDSEGKIRISSRETSISKDVFVKSKPIEKQNKI